MTLFLALAVLAGPSLAAAQDDERVAALESQVKELQAQVSTLARAVEQLTRQLAERPATAGPAPPAADTRLTEVERQNEVLASEIERLRLGEAVARADAAEQGLGPAASKIYRTGQGLSIGGYGEMLYQQVDSTRDDGSPSGKSDSLDFLRGIVYFGYKFNDRWLFNSEIEFEHASTSKEGEASVEFAYLDYLHRPELNARFGMVLMPMGFVNELHEPTVFYGAKRPDVERVIIPSTWRENGAGIFGEVGPVSYRTYIVNGLRGAGFSSGGLRGGRQKGSEALAEDLAWVGRLDFRPKPGLLFGASAYVGPSGQTLADASGPIGVDTRIYEGHFEWRYRGLQLRLLGTRAELDDVARLDAALGLSGSRSVGESLEGAYLELAYDLFNHRDGTSQLVPYLRWEAYDTQATVPGGFARNPASDVESLTLGLAFRPLDQVIFKVDYQDYDNGSATAVDQVNVAVGYIF